MQFPNEQALHEAAHGITIEFLRRNAPAPLAKGATYVLSTDTRINALVDEYLKTSKKVIARLRED